MFSSLRSYRVFVLALFVLLAVFHAAGFRYSLYYFVWWYDIPMHLAGGFSVALLSSYVFFLRKKAESVPVRKVFQTIFVSVLIVGILWEIFEFAIDQVFVLHGFDIVDTLADLINDMIGAFVGAKAYLFFGRGLKEKETVKNNQTVQA